ncbi:hypothetical protein RBE51_11065 [Pseudomonas taiwanensis]|uniref:Cap15 family CBASS effector n=1 Tax=Pseudomonas taiwanensis TaxID=470150 RepID=UPI0028E05173|nr:hypothetical protein [Pseudomonas taiwanensis]MDT8923360.1 hypothetical protein [Pseudomonas taiwanensis]
MVHDHEYSLLGGINQAVIGRFITLLASGVSATLVFVVLTLVDLAKRFNLNVNVPPTLMSLIGAGVVFTILYAAFSRAVWKWPWAVKFLRVPDLSGEWECTGTTLDDLGNVRFCWQAVGSHYSNLGQDPRAHQNGSVVLSQHYRSLGVR